MEEKVQLRRIEDRWGLLKLPEQIYHWSWIGDVATTDAAIFLPSTNPC
jgi:hypothetical protein